MVYAHVLMRVFSPGSLIPRPYRDLISRAHQHSLHSLTTRLAWLLKHPLYSFHPNLRLLLICCIMNSVHDLSESCLLIHVCPLVLLMTDDTGRREVSSQARGTTLPATPLGTLSTIPRELRNDIYQYLFPEKLVVYSKSKAKANSPVTHSLLLAIFRTSKLIGEEAMRVFYSETIFICRFDCQLYKHGDLPSPALSRRMSNIEATIPCGYGHRPPGGGWFLSSLRSANEDSPSRNTLRIVFANDAHAMQRIRSTGFFEYLEYLRDFRNIVMEVMWTTSSWDISAGIVHEISNVDEERVSKDLSMVMDEIEGTVAKVLIAGEKCEISPRTGFVYARRTVFHPRELPAKQNHRQNILLEAGEVEA